MAILSRGSRGTGVEEVQRLLNQKLVPSPNLETDGIFGSKTDKAVRKFQRKNWLVIDGDVGPCTLNALRGTEKYVISYNVTLRPQPTTSTCWAASTAMIKNMGVQAVINHNSSVGSGGLLNDSDLDDPKNTQKFAKNNGLTIIYGQSWTAQGFAGVMSSVGPLMLHILWDPTGYTTRDPSNPSRWVGSSGHFVVCTGMRGDGTAVGSTIRLNDPWPPGKGEKKSFGYKRWMQDHMTGTYQILHR